MLDESIKMKIVEGIELGLRNAKIAKRENMDKFDNAVSLRKIDKVMSSVCCKLEEDGQFGPKMFFRGSYKILLGYNKESRTLFSFMSEDRLNNLIYSNKLSDKKNYIFGLMKFNSAERQQQCLFPLTDEILDENEKVMNHIKKLIEETDDIKYITVQYKIKDYKLVEVQELKLSQYAEIIEQNDMSDYIGVNYEDVYADEVIEKEEITGDLEFNFKSEILNKSKNLEIGIGNETERMQRDGE